MWQQCVVSGTVYAEVRKFLELFGIGDWISYFL